MIQELVAVGFIVVISKTYGLPLREPPRPVRDARAQVP